MTNKFKNAIGAHLLKPIFFEYDNSEHNYSVYTLKDYDHEWQGQVYPSLRKLYVEMEDPTEYDFACKYLDGWMHWKKLSESSFFQEYLRDWREELDVRMRAKSLNRIKARAASNEKDSLQADKILLSGGWKPASESKVGRPSKEKIQAAADQLFREKDEFDADFERLTGRIN